MDCSGRPIVVFLVFALLANGLSLSCGREDFPSSPVVSVLLRGWCRCCHGHGVPIILC